MGKAKKVNYVDVTRALPKQNCKPKKSRYGSMNQITAQYLLGMVPLQSDNNMFGYRL